MKVKNISKLVLSMSLAVSVVSCSLDVNQAQNSVKTDNTKITQKIDNGTIKINLDQFFKNAKKNFQVKRYFFDNSEVDKIKISVYSVNASGNKIIDTEKEIKTSDGLSDVSLSVSPGNKVVAIRTYDVNELELSRLLSSISIKAGLNSTLQINYGTYPVASILETLMNSGVPANRAMVNTIDLAKLNKFINDITGYDLNTNTYEGVNPAFADVPAITNNIIANAGNIPTYKRGTFDTEIKGKLRITVKNTAGTILKNASITINDLTAINVTSNTDDTTVIDDVSQGTWTLRIKVSDNGKNNYAEKTISIASGGSLDQSFTIVPVPTIVQSIAFENINDNKNIGLPTNIDLNVGNSNTLKAKVTMSDRSNNQNITWESSNTNVASVSNGVISAIANGTAIIRAKATDDLTKVVSVNVTVVANNVNSEAPTISSFLPSSASAGTLVTIKGNYFDNATLTSTTVKFNNLAGTIKNINKTEIQAFVPTGATTGKISVSTAKGNAITSDFFIVSSPANTDGMVFIPGEEFNMGYDGSTDDDFYPRHKVILSSYHIDRTEVTNADFAQFITAGGYTNFETNSFWSEEGKAWMRENLVKEPNYWHDSRFNADRQPVVGISWYEAEAYAKYKGRRLPTEAEWEYAARGKNERTYPWGEDSPNEGNLKANGFFGSVGAGDGYQFTNYVGDYIDGDSPFGLVDMSGNAYEWVNDWYGSKYYANSPINNPQGSGIGGTKVLRGGSWFNHPYFSNDSSKITNSMTTYYRLFSSPTNRSNYLGFRTAK